MGTLGYIYTLQKYIICIATIYNEKLNISFEEVFHQNNSVLHVQYTNNRIKTQLYNKSIFFLKEQEIFLFSNSMMNYCTSI
jgi:hypothetical protein